MENIQKAILTADMHLRETAPRNRKDDYVKAMAKKLLTLREQANELGAVVVDAGDMFDRWKSPHSLVIWANKHLPKLLYTVAGNHDLPNHNEEAVHKSALGVLAEFGRVKAMQAQNQYSFAGGFLGVVAVPYSRNGQEFSRARVIAQELPDRRRMIVFHGFVSPDKAMADMVGGYWAQDLVEFFDGIVDVVLCGDNHETFTVEGSQGTTLINPGSMMRMSMAQVDHRPCYWVWDLRENTLHRKYHEIDPNVFDIASVSAQKEKDQRIQAFAEKVRNQQYELGVSYKRNLDQFFRKNKTKKPVQELIYQSLDGGKI